MDSPDTLDARRVRAAKNQSLFRSANERLGEPERVVRARARADGLRLRVHRPRLHRGDPALDQGVRGDPRSPEPVLRRARPRAGRHRGHDRREPGLRPRRRSSAPAPTSRATPTLETQRRLDARPRTPLRTRGRARNGRARARAGRSADQRSSRARTSCPSSSSTSIRSASSCRSSTSRSSRERSQPTSSAASGRGPTTRSSLRFERPQLRDRAAPAQRPRPDDVGDGGALEVRSEPRVATRCVRPLARVDDEPVDDVDELLERLVAERRLPAPAQEDRQVGEREREHDARGRAGPFAVQADLDHLGADGALQLGQREALERDVGLEVVPAAVLREEQQRSRRVPLREPRERLARRLLPLRRRPRDVGHRARAHVHVGPQARELSLDLADDAHRRLHERPSRWSSSSAASGPHVPAS